MKANKEKDRGDGCIFILAGASTAGKTSICNEVERQNAESIHLPLEIYGQDKAIERGASRVRLLNHVYDHAIENSRRGISTILDLGLVSAKLVENFEKYLEERNFACPIYRSFLYLPFTEIARRMELRNDDLDPANHRRGVIHFYGFSNVFKAVPEGSGFGDRLTREQILGVVERVKDLNDSPEDCVEHANSIAKRIGFVDGQDSVEIGIANTEFTHVYHSLRPDSASKNAALILHSINQIVHSTTNETTTQSATSLLGKNLAKNGERELA
jgi:chloramphenicol 3-O-phosphotransferase